MIYKNKTFNAINLLEAAGQVVVKYDNGFTYEGTLGNKTGVL